MSLNEKHRSNGVLCYFFGKLLPIWMSNHLEELLFSTLSGLIQMIFRLALPNA